MAHWNGFIPLANHFHAHTNLKFTTTCMASLPSYLPFFFFFLFFTQKFTFDKAKKHEEVGTGTTRGSPCPAGPNGQLLLTCLMVRFPSSIQPAKGCSHHVAVGRAKIHQVSPHSCPSIISPHPPLFYPLLGAGGDTLLKTMSSFPIFLPQPIKSQERGGNCPPGSYFKPQPRDVVVG